MVEGIVDGQGVRYVHIRWMHVRGENVHVVARAWPSCHRYGRGHRPVSCGCCGRQEAARQDPDNAEYRVLIKKYKRMEATKEAGNQAFKANNFQVRVCMCVCVHRLICCRKRIWLGDRPLACLPVRPPLCRLVVLAGGGGPLETLCLAVSVHKLVVSHAGALQATRVSMRVSPHGCSTNGLSR